MGRDTCREMYRCWSRNASKECELAIFTTPMYRNQLGFGKSTFVMGPNGWPCAARSEDQRAMRH